MLRIVNHNRLGLRKGIRSHYFDSYSEIKGCARGIVAVLLPSCFMDNGRREVQQFIPMCPHIDQYEINQRKIKSSLLPIMISTDSVEGGAGTNSVLINTYCFGDKSIFV